MQNGGGKINLWCRFFWTNTGRPERFLVRFESWNKKTKIIQKLYAINFRMMHFKNKNVSILGKKISGKLFIKKETYIKSFVSKIVDRYAQRSQSEVGYPVSLKKVISWKSCAKFYRPINGHLEASRVDIRAAEKISFPLK